jgi:FkbM family methyltransferase
MIIKFIKKIISWFGYKLIDKNYIKNKRTLTNKYLNLDCILDHLFSNKLINDVIQIGANDGLRFDPLNKFLNKYETKTIFVEPIKKYFEDLKKNYSNKKNCYFENSAISDQNSSMEIFKVREEYLNLYDDHVAGISSFNREHLIKHNVKPKHIISDIVNSLTIKTLIDKYNIINIDLLFIDVEGYEGKIISDFFNSLKLRPIIIFEYIHIDNKIFKKVIDLFNAKNYIYIESEENLICFPEEKKIIFKQSNL